MTAPRPSRAGKVCAFLGILLVAGALALFLWQQISAARSRQQSALAVELLLQCIPEAVDTVWEVRSDPQMPVLSIGGADYLGLLELPGQSTVFPVLAEAAAGNSAPARQSGSLYDGSLVLTGTTGQGQFDFYQALSVGDSLYFTDVTGARFACRISSLRYGTPVHGDAENAILVLILPNASGFEPLYLYAAAQT